MAPKLYGILPSPPVRSVLMCAKALEIELELVPVNVLKEEQLKDDFLKKNPQHTVPLLEDDDGFILADSHAIMAYLVAKYGKDDSLYPRNDARQKALIDHRLHFDSGILFARGALVGGPLIYKNVKPAQNTIDALREAFQFLEQILVDNNINYIAGNDLSIADFSITSSITSWNLFVPYADFTNLNAYINRMQELPCYEGNIAGLTIFTTLILPKLEN